MASDSQAQAIGEIIAWLEKQVREARDEQTRNIAQLDQLRRQVHELAEELTGAERSIREVDPKLVPFKGLPEKVREMEEGSEHIRQAIASNRADIENALRLIRAEAEYDRQERSEAFKRIEAATVQLGLVLADVAQVQSQTGQLGQTVQSLLERQREAEDRINHYGLRLDRTIEVNRDLEDRVRDALTAEQDERFDVVFERLQVVGEMVKRNEDMIAAVVAERSLREEVLQEIGVWRQEHGRIDSRLDALEETADKLLGQVDKLHGDITLLEGRHSGLGERVAGMRRDIAEVVDHVREEFTKYNQMLEKQRRKQIQGLEQELREMKFHAFRPPEEP
jgi:chromosome segregation ATPase